MDASAIVTGAQVQGNILETGDTGAGKGQDRSAEVEKFTHQMEEVTTKIDELEHKVDDVAQFCSSSSKKQLNNIKGSSFGKDREKEKQSSSNKKNLDPTRKEAAGTKRMQDLMRQFATILRQITQHKWAWPFMEPVDVEGLRLHDYYKVIKKPMDLGTIRNQMEAKDGTGYKNVREIYADVRLVFHNAMTYNDERNDVHVMAKTLLAKFEEKWLQLLPKVVEEEKRQKQEEAEAYLDMRHAQEAANAKLARDISNELCELESHLEELRETVVQKCRKMTTEEKRKLGSGLSRLSPEDLNKALEIIARKNPNFQATAEEVDIDMDAQSESTLWRLKFFVKNALEAKNSASKNQNSKRQREICDAIAKNAKKRSARAHGR